MTEKKTKILVAVDGSENSERALKEAKKYGEMSQAEITILSVLNHGFALQSSKETSADNGKTEQTREEIGEAILTEALKSFKDYEGEVYTSLRNGYPADEILEEADFGEFDLIVMGSRGLGLFSRTFLGSVSNKVLNHTKSNVLIVK